MKRLITLLAMYFFIAFAQAQNITNAEYFFDSDPGVGNGTAITVPTPGSTVNLNANISTTSLSAGFHFIGIRVKDANGEWSHYEKRGFYISGTATDAANITAAEYFFDTDPGAGNGTALSIGTSGSTVNFTANIPTSLGAGFHFLAIRVKGSDGMWGHYEKRGFYISNASADAANITAAEYFFDTDPGIGNGTALSVGSAGGTVNFTANIPTSLGAGFHFLAIRVKGSDGIWGHYEKRGFYVSSAAVDAANITAAEYFIDSDPGVGNGSPLSVGASGATVNFTASIPTSVSPGFHFLCIRTKGSNGQWGLFEKRGFYVSAATNDMANITAAEYFFDADPGIGNGTALSITTPGATVTQTFLITEPGLILGTHYLTIRVKDANGFWSLFAYDTLNIGNSTISCPANAAVTAAAGECSAAVNNIDPNVNPPQAYTYTLTGATTGTGTGTASGRTFNAGVTTVNYKLTGSPSVNCSFTVTVTASAPTIATQPASQSACTGNNITFTVSANGSALSYQWRKGGNNISGANNASYTINTVAAGDAGNYDVVITSSCGLSTISSIAVLTVGNTNITTQPSGQSVCLGASATFSVGASGSGLSYQWRKGGNNISGANNATYTINTVTAGDAGNYDVVVTGSCGNATSGIAVLSINAATSITTQPASQTVCAGSNITFTVAASGTGTISYQWRKGGSNISGANSATYTINAVTAGDAGTYDVIATGSCGSVTSSTATLTVNAATAITVQPVNQSSCPGGSVTFSVTATGTNLNYQWKKGNTNIAGANTASYTLSSITAGDAGDYSVIVTGTCGTVTSSVATLSITAGTSINTQPVSQSACIGGSVTFTVAAGGSGTISYQWKKNGTNINGANAAAYSINSVTAGDAADYTVVVTSSCGSSTSSVATLSLLASTSITTQPLSQVACSGSPVSFTVAAAGENLSYQWRKGGTNISGASNAAYTINAVSAADLGSYDVVVTGTCGAVISNTATLTTGDIVINTAPATQTLCSGSNVTFNVTAAGSGLTYQWRKGGNNISGANAATYSISNVTVADAGDYDVVITGTCGSLTSAAATLTVNTAPAITTQPTAQTVCAGTSATFTVAATGTSISYQWRKGGNNISGANTAAYSISNVAAADAGNYDVVVTGTCTPAATSNSAVLSVNSAPVISSQPVSQTVFAGAAVSFTVTASGTGLSYQWQKNGSDIPGANNSSYTINNAATTDGGSYTVLVSGTCSPAAVSSIATLTVNPFAITAQPVNQSVCTGNNAIFSISVSGTGLSYQWQVKEGSNAFADITGATAATLTITAVSASQNGNQYRCIVSGSLSSNVATLTVNNAPAVTLNLTFDSLYQNGNPEILQGGLPLGGTYTGTVVNNGVVKPAELNLGNYNISYSYTDANGCTAAAADVFTVIPRTLSANFSPNPSFDGNVNLIVLPEMVGTKAVVYDAIGRRVHEFIIGGRYNSFRFNWASGIYTFVFTRRNIVIVKRLVIQR